VTYATPADIRDALAPDGDVTGTAGELEDTQIQAQIQRGQDLVDATTGTAFTDVNVPDLLKGLTIALGSYYATLAYRKGKALEQFHPVYLQYLDARQTLKDIKANLLDFEPGAPTTDDPPQRKRPRVINTQNATMFALDDVGLRVSTGEDGPRFENDPGMPGRDGF
jgi:hypothetical protein